MIALEKNATHGATYPLSAIPPAICLLESDYTNNNTTTLYKVHCKNKIRAAAGRTAISHPLP